jgi:hypothetical protein
MEMYKSFNNYAQSRNVCDFDSKMNDLCECIASSGIPFNEFWVNVGLDTITNTTCQNENELLEAFGTGFKNYAQKLHEDDFPIGHNVRPKPRRHVGNPDFAGLDPNAPKEKLDTRKLDYGDYFDRVGQGTARFGKPKVRSQGNPNFDGFGNEPKAIPVAPPAPRSSVNYGDRARNNVSDRAGSYFDSISDKSQPNAPMPSPAEEPKQGMFGKLRSKLGGMFSGWGKSNAEEPQDDMSPQDAQTSSFLGGLNNGNKIAGPRPQGNQGGQGGFNWGSLNAPQNKPDLGKHQKKTDAMVQQIKNDFTSAMHDFMKKAEARTAGPGGDPYAWRVAQMFVQKMNKLAGEFQLYAKAGKPSWMGDFQNKAQAMQQGQTANNQQNIRNRANQQIGPNIPLGVPM